MPSFHATRCGASTLGRDILVTGWSAPEQEGDCYLMLQFSRGPLSPQDLELGFDQPYIEFCGQAWSWYGHINEFVLRRSEVVVQMDRTAASTMDSDGRMHVTFDLDEPAFSALQAALEETFSRYGCFRVEC